MNKGYWVKGYPFKNADKTEYSDKPVIHSFDTEKEAEFFRSQIAHGEILSWGEKEVLQQMQEVHYEADIRA